MLKAKTYDYFNDNMLEVIHLLREAKKADSFLKVKVKLGKSTIVLSTKQTEEEWAHAFNFESIDELVDIYCRKAFISHKLVMGRAELLDFQFQECKYDIYPQRAQQFIDFVENLPEFEKYYQRDYVENIISYSIKRYNYPVAVVDCITALSKREVGNPDKAFGDILQKIALHEKFVKRNQKNPNPYERDEYEAYDRDTIYTSLITFYPGGFELIKQYDSEYMGNNYQRFESIIKENEQYSKELIESSIDPTLTDPPITTAKTIIKNSIVAEIEEQQDCGFEAQIITDLSVLSFDEIYSLLKAAKTTKTPLTINDAMSTAPEETWYDLFLNQTKEEYAEDQALNTQQQATLAEIKEKYIDGMRDHIHPQRFQLWKKFVEKFISISEWSKPTVSLDPIIPALAEYIPMVNKDSILLDKKVASKINEIDGPLNTASIINLLLFSKRGPDFVKNNYQAIYQIREKECLQIAAENAAFEKEIQKARTFSE